MIFYRLLTIYKNSLVGTMPLKLLTNTYTLYNSPRPRQNIRLEKKGVTRAELEALT